MLPLLLPVKEMFGIITLVGRRPVYDVSKIPQPWKTQKSLEVVCGEGSMSVPDPRKQLPWQNDLVVTLTVISSALNSGL